MNRSFRPDAVNRSGYAVRLSVLENLTIPAFVALSEDDETIDSSHTIDIFRRFMSNSRNRMQIYTNTPQIYHSDAKIEALQSNIASENILSFASE